jgi:hypothetical protein
MREEFDMRNSMAWQQEGSSTANLFYKYQQQH